MANISPEGLFALMKGKPSPRRSRTPIIHDAQPDPLNIPKRRQLRQALRKVAALKRFKPKHPLITPSPTKKESLKLPALRPCIKRFLEFQGWESRFFDYIATPKLIAPLAAKIIYELHLYTPQTGTVPVISFTDSSEAFATLTALQANGYGPDVKLHQRDLSREEVNMR